MVRGLRRELRSRFTKTACVCAINNSPYAEEPAEGRRLEARTMSMQSSSQMIEPNTITLQRVTRSIRSVTMRGHVPCIPVIA